MKHFAFTVFAALLCSLTAAANDLTVVHAGTALLVPGEAPRTNVSIISENGRFVGIEDGFVTRDGATTVDLRDHFVLPGMIDAHDHITAKPGRNKRLWITTVDDSLQALYGAHYAKLTLEAGFTTVRNIGSTGTAIFALRRAINEGLVPGPRLLAAGSFLSVTGGHGDKTTGFIEPILPGIIHDGLCDGPAECMKAVRTQIRRGADWIKVMVTGGVNSEANTGIGQHFSDAELKAIVDTTHRLGRKVAGHAHAASGVNAALRAGFDSIEHGAFIDDESIRLFKETGAFLVATLSVGDHVLHLAADPNSGMSDAVRVKAREAIPTMMANVGRAFKGGVKVVFGTDSGEPEHGRNADEFKFLVDIGMSEMEAIEAATTVAADMLDMEGEVGRIAPGLRADLVAVTGNPLDDITVLTRTHAVMKDGAWAKTPK